MPAPHRARRAHRVHGARHPARGRGGLRGMLPAALALIVLPAASAGAEGPIDLGLYARLLERHTVAVDAVVGTRVDYRALGASADWARLAEQVRAAKPTRLVRTERLAFWINAYNILAIDLVIAHYPVDSIRDIGSFLYPVWKRPVAEIEGRSISLGEIEHGILREMGEPRIHAAIVCASTSCPSLARTPFRPERLDADLEATTRRWLRDPRKGLAIERDRGTIRLSKIFDWFEEDFEQAGGVLEFVARYLPEDDAAWIEQNGTDARIRSLEYDWTLNDWRRGGS